MLVDLMLAELADLRTAEDDFDKGEARKVCEVLSIACPSLTTLAGCPQVV